MWWDTHFLHYPHPRLEHFPKMPKHFCFSSEPFSTPLHFRLFQCSIFLHSDEGLSGVIFPSPLCFASLLLAGSAIFWAPHSLAIDL